jgi:transposase
MTARSETRRIIVGVDTHKHVHVAVAIDASGVRLEDRSFPADTGGYKQLAEWAATLGRVTAYGLEGTGSYGAGLTSLLRRRGHHVVEVNRGNRQARRTAGKSDTADAEVAARQVLAGVATAVPKTGDGQIEILRQVKVARDTAVKARTSAIITLKQIIVNAPAELREELASLGDKTLSVRMG